MDTSSNHPSGESDWFTSLAGKTAADNNRVLIQRKQLMAAGFSGWAAMTRGQHQDELDGCLMDVISLCRQGDKV
jgi:hypothetical protein